MKRTREHRCGARVICTSGPEVLLLADSDPGIPGTLWWVSPGGGIDEGETPREAAIRELYEETGLAVNEQMLIGPVARRLVTHGYSDRVRVQDEWFFRVEVNKFQVAPAALSVGEQQRSQGHGWFPLDALPQHVWPSKLARLARLGPDEFVDLGTVEESTVPVGRAEQG